MALLVVHFAVLLLFVCILTNAHEKHIPVFKVIEERLDWQNAELACRQLEPPNEWFLATFNTYQEFLALRQVCKTAVDKTYAEGCWVGLERVKPNSNRWDWSNNEIARSSYVMNKDTGAVSTGQGPWCDVCPDNYEKKENCGNLWKWEQFELNDGWCGAQPYHPICDRFRAPQTFQLCLSGSCSSENARAYVGTYSRVTKLIYQKDGDNPNNFRIEFRYRCQSYSENQFEASCWNNGWYLLQNGNAQAYCEKDFLEQCQKGDWEESDEHSINAKELNIRTGGTLRADENDAASNVGDNNNDSVSIYTIVAISGGAFLIIVLFIGVCTYYRIKNNKFKQMQDMVKDEEVEEAEAESEAVKEEVECKDNKNNEETETAIVTQQ